MKTYVQDGEVITLTAPAAVNSGDPVLVGSVLGVAQADAASGDPVTLVRRGVFTLPKAAGQSWTEGAKLYWSTANSNFTTTATGNTLAGFAAAAAGSADTTGDVLLTGQAV